MNNMFKSIAILKIKNNKNPEVFNYNSIYHIDNLSFFNKSLLRVPKKTQKKLKNDEIAIPPLKILTFKNAFIDERGIVFSQNKKVIEYNLNSYYDSGNDLAIPNKKYAFYMLFYLYNFAKKFKIPFMEKISIFVKNNAFKHYSKEVFHKKQKRAIITIDGECVIAFDEYYTNYTHFINESYPRLYHFFQSIPQNKRDKIKVILPMDLHSHGYNLENYNYYDHINPCLKALNILESQKVFLKGSGILNTSFLYLPTQIKFHPNNKIAFELLKTSHQISKKIEVFDKIYISREKSPNRKFINEKDVIKKLEQFGFKKIIMEDMKFEEKIHVMNNARYVCCGESSSITNILFANKNLKIINIRPKNMPVLYNLILSTFMEADMYYTLSHQIDDRNLHWTLMQTKVDINLLEDVVHSTGLKKIKSI